METDITLFYHTLIKEGPMKGAYLFMPPGTTKTTLGIQIAIKERKMLLEAGHTIVETNYETPFTKQDIEQRLQEIMRNNQP